MFIRGMSKPTEHSLKKMSAHSETCEHSCADFFFKACLLLQECLLEISSMLARFRVFFEISVLSFENFDLWHLILKSQLKSHFTWQI